MMRRMDPQAWRRLADTVRQRRDHLALSQAELAVRAHVSESTVRSIEAARRTGFRRGTLRTLSEALGWSSDSIDRILDGLDPIVPDAPLERAPPDLAAQVALLQREVAELRRLLEARTKTG